jgi:hypothetical protein
MDYINQEGIEKKFEEMGISEDELWDMLYESSYQRGNQSNYNYDSSYNDYSSYSSQKLSNYTDAEKWMLKKIYKVLAANFHRDKYKEDGGESLVNRLKG